jgi:hypothetical protein
MAVVAAVAEDAQGGEQPVVDVLRAVEKLAEGRQRTDLELREVRRELGLGRQPEMRPVAFH